MRIIKVVTLRDWTKRHPTASSSLFKWATVAKSSAWKKVQDVRKAFPHADPVAVKSGRIVTVFNICGNHYRLITAIHYDKQRVFVLRFLTHAEYSKNTWKNEL